MCIAIFTNAHPDFALIVINNRDEFLDRPTKRADWWDPPNSNVLGGRDLLREEQGTWLGITREGRIAVLTNFREEGEIKPEARSRGGLVNAFLTQPAASHVSTEGFLSLLAANDGLKGIGGFSLVCGRVGEPLAVISNRTPDVRSLKWILEGPGETAGLSNAVITDRSWTKVTEGEEMMQQAVDKSDKVHSSEEALTEDLFRILSNDTLPKRKSDDDWASQVKQLRKSIFIPAVGGEAAQKESAEDLAAAKTDGEISHDSQSGPATSPKDVSGTYGTQKQTVITVSNDGEVTYIERTLFDNAGRLINLEEQSKSFSFSIRS